MRDAIQYKYTLHFSYTIYSCLSVYILCLDCSLIIADFREYARHIKADSFTVTYIKLSVQRLKSLQFIEFHGHNTPYLAKTIFRHYCVKYHLYLLCVGELLIQKGI